MKKILLYTCFLALSACTTNGVLIRSSGDYVQSEEGVFKIGMPYQIENKSYYPEEVPVYTEEGEASWYEDDFSGDGLTANGELFNPNAMTAAHKTLPLPSLVRIVNLENGLSALVRINDRGPFAHNRIVDVSRRVAEILDFHKTGTTQVRVVLLKDESQDMKNDLVSQGRYAKDPNTLKSINNPLKKNIKTEELMDISSSEESFNTEGYAPEGLFIQMGIFSDYNNALNLENELKASVENVRIQKFEQMSSQQLYRVLVGPFDTQDNARQVLGKIKEAGYDAFLKEIKNP